MCKIANFSRRHRFKFMVVLFLFYMAPLALIGFAPDAEAAKGTKGKISAFETPMDALVNAMTGPIAYGVSVTAIVAAGAMLVFGGEMSEFAKKLIMLALVIGVIMFATSLMGSIWGKAGALMCGTAP